MLGEDDDAASILEEADDVEEDVEADDLRKDGTRNDVSERAPSDLSSGRTPRLPGKPPKPNEILSL